MLTLRRIVEIQIGATRFRALFITYGCLIDVNSSNPRIGEQNFQDAYIYWI